MHHGTCVTHVPCCMPGSLTSGFFWSSSKSVGKMFPTFPAHAQPAVFRTCRVQPRWEGPVGFRFWEASGRVKKKTLKLSEVNLNCDESLSCSKTAPSRGLIGQLAEPFCKVNPFPQHSKNVSLAMQWKIWVVMSANALSNTTDQSLWRNNKNNNSGQMVLV